LKKKSAEITLRVLKNFIIEAERLTEQKLMRVRVDHRQEWNNQMWVEFKNKEGFILEHTTIYTYQQNSIM